MIIVLLFMAVIATFISFIYITNISLRTIFSLIFGFISIASVGLIIGNNSHHYLMTPKTYTSSEQRIYPTQSIQNKNLIIYQKIGTDSNYTVQTYRDQPNQKSINHTTANPYTFNNIQYINGNEATMKTTTKKWVYTKSSKFWFGAANWKFKNDKSNFDIIKKVNQFYIPKGWQNLSTDQVK